MFLSSRFTIDSFKVSLKSIIEGTLEDIKDSISDIEFCTDEEIYAFLEPNKKYTFVFEKTPNSYPVDAEVTLNICDDRTNTEEVSFNVIISIKSVTDVKNHTLVEAIILYKT